MIHLSAQGTGASMIPGALLYLNGGLLSYFIVLLLSIGTAYILTYMVMKNDPTNNEVI